MERKARQRLGAFLLCHGRVYHGKSRWTQAHFRWLEDQRCDRPVQQVVFQEYVYAVLRAQAKTMGLEVQMREVLGTWLLRPTVEPLVPLLGELLWHVVRRRWRLGGVPRALTLTLDSTVSVRYGRKQAGAERGYNPHKPGRPSHHPLLAFVQETGDCMGIRWRAGNAHTAAGAEAWITDVVGRLRSVGVETITVRLDKAS